MLGQQVNRALGLLAPSPDIVGSPNTTAWPTGPTEDQGSTTQIPGRDGLAPDATVVQRHRDAANHGSSGVQMMELQVLDTQMPDAPEMIAIGCAADAEVANELDEATAVFVGARSRLFGIAYRILGTVNESEDVVQEVWLRWHGTNRAVVANPSAFLATTTTRLAITVLQSARKRRETYFGCWLTEPVDTSVDPQTTAERDEAVEMAVQLLLEKLTSRERAAFVLREAFDYPYQQISEILQLRIANTRQIVRRARNHVVADRSAPVDPDAHRRLVRAFVAAAAGELGDLEDLLAEGATG